MKRRRRCQWCAGPRPARATWRTRWPAVVNVEDEFGGGETYPWCPPRVIVLCGFHVRFARRYPGVRAYAWR